MTNDASLPCDNHVSRYCKPTTVGRDGRPMRFAFMPRQDEEYLSVNWLEYFGEAVLDDAIDRVRTAFSDKGYRVARSGRFVALNVGAAKAAVNRRVGVALRVKHLPFSDDQSHAGIFGYTSSDEDVAAELAALIICADVYPARA